MNTPYRWWNTKSLMNCIEHGNQQDEKNFSFHPGSYLQKAQRLIHILCGVIFVIFAFSYIKETRCIYNTTSLLAETLASLSGFENVILWTKNNLPDLRSAPEKIITWQNWEFLLIYFLVLGILFFLFFRAALRQRARRIILEEGLLSIQSCAVVWRLVIFSHLKALEQGEKENKYYKGYTRRLVDCACVIKGDIVNIHDTIMKDIWPTPEEHNNRSLEIVKREETVPSESTNRSVSKQRITSVPPLESNSPYKKPKTRKKKRNH